MVFHDETEMLGVDERSGGVAEEDDGGCGEEAKEDEEEGEQVGEPVTTVWLREPGLVLLLQGSREPRGWQWRLACREGRQCG